MPELHPIILLIFTRFYLELIPALKTKTKDSKKSNYNFLK